MPDSKAKSTGRKNAGFRMAGVFSLLSLVLCAACSRPAVYPDAPVSGTEIVIDANALDPDIPRFFTYNANGEAVNFFVLKTGAEVFSFLDACKTCKPPLGYTFRDGIFTCRVCGERYTTASIKKGVGACYPIRIFGKLKNGKYHLPVSELRRNM